MHLPAHSELSRLPTPVIPFEHFFGSLKKYKLWLKRDDLTGLELSGNKVRKLDFLMNEARLAGAERIITCGGLQSNHCRSAAFFAKQCGMKSTLVLRGQEPEIPTGNYLLNHLLGIDIHFVDQEAYRHADQVMQRIAQNAGEKCYIIPEGGSNEVGAWGYVKCFQEITGQSQAMNVKWDTIVTATGSGGTHAGLLLGKLLLKSDVNIITVNVCDDAGFFKDKIDAIMRRFCERYNLELNWTEEDIQIIDGYVGEGYGLIGRRETEVIRRMAETEGIIIDPVYGAKALAGLDDQLQQGQIPGEKILFIHTGGIFGLFPHWQAFSA